MTTPSTLMKFTLLAATLAAGMVLSTAGGAYAHDRDLNYHRPIDHGPGSDQGDRDDRSGYGERDRDRDHDRDRDRDDNDHPPYHDNPIVVHPVHGPGSSHNPIVVVVRNHGGSGFPGDVRDHRGLDGAPGGATRPVRAGGFQGDVRDHR